MADELLFEVADKVATITLNRPERRNAFTKDMFDAWINALEESQARDDINVVILTGAGTAFCSGGDVKAMGERELNPLEEKNYLWENLNRLPLTMEHIFASPVPARVSPKLTLKSACCPVKEQPGTCPVWWASVKLLKCSGSATGLMPKKPNASAS
jgi:hypothetical protein